jgi:hypothetical protein
MAIATSAGPSYPSPGKLGPTLSGLVRGMRNPRACILLERTELIEVERVANLARDWLTVLHGFPPVFSMARPSRLWILKAYHA